jgi:hypothetical protein
VTQCVIADAIACNVLASQAVPRFLRADKLSIVVVDGLIAFLRQLTGHGGAAYRPVLGLVGGALDAEIASRLPSGTHLISAMDHSAHGNRAHQRLERLVATARPDLIVSRGDQP